MLQYIPGSWKGRTILGYGFFADLRFPLRFIAIVSQLKCYNMDMEKADKDKATFCFCRLADGNVVGEIIDEAGVVVDSKNFGMMSVVEFERVLDLVNQEYPKLAGKLLPTVELTGN